MAGKRLSEGTPGKAMEFNTDVIPSALTDSIRRRLATVETVGESNAIFDDAHLWFDHADTRRT